MHMDIIAIRSRFFVIIYISLVGIFRGEKSKKQNIYLVVEQFFFDIFVSNVYICIREIN